MTKLELRRGSTTPLYLQFKEIIKEKIDSGEWETGYILPGELKLKDMFGISRVTIRQALKELIEEDYIKASKGFGTYVSKNMNDFVSTQSFSNEMVELNYNNKTLEATLSFVSNQETGNLFNTQEIQCLQRVRAANGQPIVYSITYLCKECFVEDKKEILFGSLYEYLLSKKINFASFNEVITAKRIDESIAKKLKLDDNFAIIRLRYGYDKNGDLMEYTINYYNPNQYEYRMKITSPIMGGKMYGK